MSFKELVEEFELNLINRKQQLNEEIDDIIYSDLKKELTYKDINEIQEKRKRIKVIYDTIEYLDKCILNYVEK